MKDDTSLCKFMQQFPDEKAVTAFFEQYRWHNGKPVCPHCTSFRVRVVRSGKPMPDSL